VGYAQRTRHRLVGMMRQQTVLNRVRVWLAFADHPSPPPKIRGWAGVRWVLTGRVEGRTTT